MEGKLLPFNLIESLSKISSNEKLFSYFLQVFSPFKKKKLPYMIFDYILTSFKSFEYDIF